MRLTNGLRQSCDAVLPWSVENDFLHVVGVKTLVKMSAPGRVYLGELVGVDHCVMQCLLPIWLSQGSTPSLASRDTSFVREDAIDPRAFDEGVDRPRGMVTWGWAERG